MFKQARHSWSVHIFLYRISKISHFRLLLYCKTTSVELSWIDEWMLAMNWTAMTYDTVCSCHGRWPSYISTVVCVTYHYRPSRPICEIPYDTGCYFNVRSKADTSRLNLPHGTDNEKVKNRRKKLKSKKRICSEVSIIRKESTVNALLMHLKHA